MKRILIYLTLLTQLAFSADWKIESVTIEPYVHSPIKGATKITIEVTNISKGKLSATTSPYPHLKGYLRPQTYLFQNNETLKQLVKRNPRSHFNKYNSGCCFTLESINVDPKQTVKMVMYDNDVNAGKRLALYISSFNSGSDNVFLVQITLPKLTKDN